MMTHLRSQDPPRPCQDGMCRKRPLGARRPGSDTSICVGNWLGDLFWVTQEHLASGPPSVKEGE